MVKQRLKILFIRLVTGYQRFYCFTNTNSRFNWNNCPWKNLKYWPVFSGLCVCVQGVFTTVTVETRVKCTAVLRRTHVKLVILKYLHFYCAHTLGWPWYSSLAVIRSLFIIKNSKTKQRLILSVERIDLQPVIYNHVSVTDMTTFWHTFICSITKTHRSYVPEQLGIYIVESWVFTPPRKKKWIMSFVTHRASLWAKKMKNKIMCSKILIKRKMKNKHLITI